MDYSDALQGARAWRLSLLRVSIPDWYPRQAEAAVQADRGYCSAKTSLSEQARCGPDMMWSKAGLPAQGGHRVDRSLLFRCAGTCCHTHRECCSGEPAVRSRTCAWLAKDPTHCDPAAGCRS